MDSVVGLNMLDKLKQCDQIAQVWTGWMDLHGFDKFGKVCMGLSSLAWANFDLM